MGEFHKATHAFMVYTDEDGMPAAHPDMPTVPSIYKIPASQVDAFKRLHDVAGCKWIPVYSMHEWTDSIRLAKEAEKDVEPE